MLLICVNPIATGQGQVVGSFPSIQGGFENQPSSGNAGSITIPVSSIQNNYQVGTNCTVAFQGTGARTGNNYIQATTGNSNNYYYSPTAGFAQNTQYVVQYYFKYPTGSIRSFAVSISPDGGSNFGTAVTSGNVGSIADWTKRTELITSANNVSTGFGLLRFGSNGGGITSPFYIDDIVVYAGNVVDNTPPNEASNPTTSNPTINSLDVNWSSPISGVDGGGYVVVRYTSDPMGQPVPNTNGIYGVGNSIGAGTVAYIGTSTSFTDNGLVSNMLYYYQIFVVDKAFNYSNPVITAGLTAVPGPIDVQISSPLQVSAANLSQGSVDNVIYSFQTQVSGYYTTLNSLTFPNTDGTYSSTDFTNLKLWYNSTSNGPGSGAITIAVINTPINATPHTFNGLSSILYGAGYFWITADVSATAVPGNSITVTPGLSTSNFGFDNPPNTSSSSATDAGQQTIVYSTLVSDYFKSNTSSDWALTSTWLSSHDDVSYFVATTPPTSGATLVRVISPHIVTISAATAIPTTIVDLGGEISISSTGSIISITGIATINGKISNFNTSTAAIVNTNTQLIFNATGYYKYDGGGTATNALIPAATWNVTSTAYVTGIGILTANGISARTPGGTGKFGNVIFHNPTMNGGTRFFGTNTTTGSPTNFQVGGSLTLGSLGSIAGPFQINTGTTTTINIDGDLNIYSGNWGFATYSPLTTTITVLGNVKIDATNATYSTGNATINLCSNTGTTNLNVTKDFYMKSGSYMASIVRTNGTASVIFNGVTQNATFEEANTIGNINFEVKNGTSVNLLSNLTVQGTLTLTSGIFNINNNIVTFHTNNTPISRTSGTMSVGTTSSLVFGKTGFTAGNAFVIPNNVFTSVPVLSNLTICRANLLTLGNQGMQLTGALTLTTGTLNIGAGALLDLNGASLSAPAGYLSGTATSDLTIRGTTGGTIMLPLSAALAIRTFTIIGTRTVQMDGTKNIGINTAGSFVLGSTAIYDNGGQSQFTKSGTPNIPTFDITGKFITRATGGFFGANSSISTGYSSSDISLNIGSTIEYGLAGDQAVQGSTVPSYYNITFSGSGTKTPASAVAVNSNGLVTITGTPTIDFSSNNLASTASNTTSFVMDGGRLKLGTAQTLPLMDGTYTLTGGVVEYNSSSVQTIRSKSYQNIEVTGTNVGNSNGNITLNNGGSFTIKAGGIFSINSDAIIGPIGSQIVTVESNGTFKCGNQEGFYGAAVGLNSPAIRNNIEIVDLQNGSIVEYNRTSAQVFSPSGNYLGVYNYNYQRLVIDGGGEKTLAGPASVNESMTFNNGVVNTTSSQLLTFETGAIVSGSPGITSYINGPAAKKMNAGTLTEFVFPLGKSTGTPIYNPAGVKPVSLSSNTQFNAEYFVNPYPSQSVMGTSLLGITGRGYWDISNAFPAGNTARVKLYYTNPGAGNWIYYTGTNSPVTTPAVNPCSYCNVAVVHRDPTITWNFTSGSSNFNSVDPEWRYYADQGFIYSHNPMSTFERFSIAFSYNVILPVHLLSFNGTLQSNDGLLGWTVADAQGLAGFELQHSHDGRSFYRLSDFSPNSNNSYSYLHKQLQTGAHFYRLKMIEKDGNISFSSVVLLTIGKLPTNIIGLKENPVHNNASVLIISASNQQVYATIGDALGRIMSRSEGQLQAGQNKWIIKTQQLARGIYFMQLQTEDGGHATIRFVKE